MIAFQFLVGALIPDYPQWIEDEMINMQNRVKQVKKIIDEKVIESLIVDESSVKKRPASGRLGEDDEFEKAFAEGEKDFVNSVDLLENALSTLHYDRDLSSLLIEKLKTGCETFMQVLQT